uniref:Uncharacterized protein n=1 Tax=viral metagenome TaxID=1070528 RepID=A0A6C0H0D2_9ZZZZ
MNKTKQKIAICFSGHPRSYKKCYENIKKYLLDRYDCDIFISSYFMSDEISNDIINIYNPIKYIFHNSYIIQKKSDIYNDTLGKIKYLNVGLGNEKSHNIDYKNYNLDNILNNAFHIDKININNLTYEYIPSIFISQLFGIYDVSQLCFEYMNLNSIKYNYILRMRLDTHIINKSGNENLEIFDTFKLKNDEILFNSIQDYSHSAKVSDFYWAAIPDVYFKMANIYNRLHEVINFINSNNKCWYPIMGSIETLIFIYTLINKLIIIESKNKFIIHKNNM